MPKLLVHDADQRVVVDLGEQPVTLGRDPDVEVPLRTPDVSRKHCRVEKRNGRYVLRDLESKNGTLVNGFLVREHALSPGDRIRIGESLLIFAEDADPSVIAFLSCETTLEDGPPPPSGETKDNRHRTPRERPITIDASAITEAGDGPFPSTDTRPIAAALPAVEIEDPEGDLSATVRLGVFGGARGADAASIQSQLLRLALLAQTISSELDLNRLLGTILDTLLSFTGFERGMLLLHDDAGQLCPRVTRSNDGLELDAEAKLFSKTIVEAAMNRRNVVTIGDLQTATGEFRPTESYQSLGIRAAVCMPLVVSTRAQRIAAAAPPESERRRRALPPSLHAIGAIYLESRAPISEYPELTREILQHAAAQAAIAIQNARLHHQATTDQLTGLVNRGYFEQLLEEELRHCGPSQIPFTLMISDLDRFKNVNDVHGHPVGDEVLRVVANLVRGLLRAEDVAGRYGGEEFIYLLPGTLAPQARVVAEKVRQAVANQHFSVPELSVTISLGIATFPGHGTESSVLMKRADQALYRAKETGRNRFAVWDESLDRVGRRADPLAGILSGDLARDHRNVQLLLRTIDLVRTAPSFEDMVEAALDNILEFTGAERALLFQRKTRGGLGLTAVRLRGGKDDHPTTVQWSRSVAMRAVKERRSCCIIDCPGGKGLSGEVVRSSSMDTLKLHTVMCVPLEVREAIVGAIYVDDKIANKEFGHADLVFFEAIANQLAVAIASREEVSRSGSFRAPWSDDGSPAEGDSGSASTISRATAEALRIENARLRRVLTEHGLL